jgi:hypothetical protein
MPDLIPTPAGIKSGLTNGALFTNSTSQIPDKREQKNNLSHEREYTYFVFS